MTSRAPIDGNASESRQTCVLVLGMHRSGTSAMTRVLNLHGVALGEDLLQPGTDNRRGYWEKRAVVDMHDRLLADLDRSWIDPRPLPEGWSATDAAARASVEIGRILGEFSGKPLFAIKDPRLCLFVNLWLPQLKRLDIRPVVVLQVRHPMEVAESIRVRNGWPHELSWMLWSRSVGDALASVAGLQRCAVTYERLLADWQGVVEDIAGKLRLELPISPGQAAPAVRDFLEPAERHHVHGIPQPGVVPRPLLEAYQVLLDMEQGKASSPSETLSVLHAEFRTSTSPVHDEYAAVFVAERARQVKLESELARRTALAQELECQLAELAARNQQLSSDQAQVVVQAAELGALHDQLRLDHARVLAEVAELGELHEQLSQERTRSQSELAQIQVRHERLQREHEQAAMKWVAADRVLVADKLAYQDYAAELLQLTTFMLRSRSWRLTSPLRWLLAKWKRSNPEPILPSPPQAEHETSLSSAVAMSKLARSRAAFRARVRQLAMRNAFHWLPPALLSVLVDRCQLFHWRWYAKHSGQQPKNKFEAARLFVARGEGGNAANPLFDADWYRGHYGFCGTPAEALLHYRWFGEPLGLQPTPWFHPRFVRQRFGMPLRRGSALGTFERCWQEMPVGHPLFDAKWYLETYPDVARGGRNPLIHYAVHGVAENRQPNAYFSPEWYASQYPDVALAGGNAALHYFERGAAGGRSPGPNFDAGRYAALHEDQRSSGLDPLAHFLVVGRTLGYTQERPAIHASTLLPERVQRPPGARWTGVVDIVVPVYRGLDETRNCIESLLRSRGQTPTRVRIYNDSSPEAEVTDYLRELAAREPRIVLVENEKNLGFVGTVNRAMRVALAADDCAAILLLNSDTVVAGDWIDRMVGHLIDAPDVASVTALSNNATICSYPQIGVNDLPPTLNVATVDEVARVANAGMSVTIPTGVGFCMLLTRRALEQVGLFDEEAFGKGYGEECDFCMRALRAGYRHLLALDVFVQHVGEVSFADSSKPGKIIGERVIAERYPEYARLVSAWVGKNPSLIARIRLTMALWRADSRPVHALITHDLGGGTERQVQRIADQLGGNGHVVVIRPVHGHPTRLKLENKDEFDGFEIEVDAGDGDGFADLLRTMGVGSVQVHHLLGHGELIREGLARSDIGFDFFVHDYFTLCPQVTLTDTRSAYCGEPQPAGCDACIRQRPSHGASDIRNWRIANEWVVRGADSVAAPSQDTAARIERYFGVRPQVRQHERLAPARSRPIVERTISAKHPIRVVLIGVLAPHKGRELAMEAVDAAQRKGLPLSFHLIGDPQGPVPAAAAGKFTWSGWYEEQELAYLIEQANPDVFLFASQAPETYSFTLTAAMETGLPIVATALGAFPERLVGYEGATLVRHDISGADLSDVLMNLFVPRAIGVRQ